MNAFNAMMDFLRAAMPLVNAVLLACLAAAQQIGVAVPVWVAIAAAGVNALAAFTSQPAKRAVRSLGRAAGLPCCSSSAASSSSSQSAESADNPLAGPMVHLFTACRNAYPPPNQLAGCLNDGRNLQQMLADRYGSRETAELLFDAQATKAQMVATLVEIGTRARDGDLVIFHESGHGTQAPDPDGTEPDGLVEIICPIDFDWSRPATWLTDKELTAILNGFRPGVRFLCLFDSCHSGDLYNERDFRSNRKPRHMPMPASIASEVSRRKALGRRSLGIRQAFGANVAWISGCTSDGTCADTYEDGEAQGAFTWAFLRAVANAPHAPVRLLATLATEILRAGGYKQVPQSGGGLVNEPLPE